MREREAKNSQRGIALLIVLWVMTILTVTALSFSLMTRAETYGTLTYRDRMEKQFLAEAGVERGIVEMLSRSHRAFYQSAIPEGEEIWKTDGTTYHGRMENGAYAVRLFDESGKISLNALTDASGIIVKNLLINLGALPEEADSIVDSILDWKDADDLHRLYGAENDYYRSLPHPYQARNADFESLEELLLVKGVTPAVLYGNDKRKGLIPFFTLYTKTATINLNTAPKEVLAALPGMNADLAEQIIQFRSLAAIRSPADITGIIGGSYSLMAPFISGPTGTSMICTIEASGYTDREKNGYPIRATVVVERPKYRYVYYRSPAESM